MLQLNPFLNKSILSPGTIKGYCYVEDLIYLKNIFMNRKKNTYVGG